jgi:acyl carrier protein
MLEQVDKYLINKIKEFMEDWDDSYEVSLQSKFFSELGFDSLDLVTLCLSIQKDFKMTLLFSDFFNMNDKPIDHSISDLAKFLYDNM